MWKLNYCQTAQDQGVKLLWSCSYAVGDFSHHHSCRCPAGTVMTTELDMEQCLLSSFCAIQCEKCDFSRLENVIEITDKISRNLVELREICISYMSLFANLVSDDIQYLSHSSHPHHTWWDYDWISLKQKQRSCSHSRINMKTTVSILWSYINPLRPRGAYMRQ